MTESVSCPVCGRDLEVGIDNVEGGTVSVTCSHCGAELKVVYEITEVDTDVSVVKAPTATFHCPKCGADAEVEDPDEDGSEDLICQSCSKEFTVDWSDWGR